MYNFLALLKKIYIFVPKVCPVKMHVFHFASIIYPDLLVANLAC